MPKSQPGNKNGTKLKEPDIRQLAYKQYCQHIAHGDPKHSFFFEHPNHSCCWETMERYLRENPSEFDPNLLREARAKRYAYWLGEGKTLMTGGYKNGSPVVWQTMMRNMFKDIGWDREQVTEANKSHVQKLAESIREDVAISQTEASDSDEHSPN